MPLTNSFGNDRGSIWDPKQGYIHGDFDDEVTVEGTQTEDEEIAEP